MTENEIQEIAEEIARLYTSEIIETKIRAILGQCKGALDVLEANEKPSMQSLRQALRIKRQAAANVG